MRELEAYLRGDESNAFVNLPPHIVEGAADAVIDLYNIAAPNGQKRAERITIQNLGAGPLKVAINQAAQANNFHYALAADSGADTGDGGTIVVFPRRDTIRKLSGISTSPVRASVVITVSASEV